MLNNAKYYYLRESTLNQYMTTDLQCISQPTAEYLWKVKEIQNRSVYDDDKTRRRHLRDDERPTVSPREPPRRECVKVQKNTSGPLRVETALSGG